jgi:hypothetical protein
VTKPALHRFGNGELPVVILDDFSGEVSSIIDVAAALTPFPFHKGNYYPGLRRAITEADEAANAYVEDSLRAAAQFIAGGFHCDRFDLLEASFSMVTTDPGDLLAAQRAPHFDSTDPKYLALLHYLNVEPGGGTAFYRQRTTGIERVTEQNVATFVSVAEREAAVLSPAAGYITQSNAHFEQLFAIEAVPDRMIIYQGSLLHSGIIPPGMNRSGNPREGRLTANFFVRAH